MDRLIAVPRRDLALVEKEKRPAVGAEIFFSIPWKGLGKITKATDNSLS